MKFIRNLIRAGAIALVALGVSVNAKPAHADGGAIIAGIAGGLILGSIIGSTSHASNGSYYNGYYVPPQTNYAPATTYYTPQYTTPRYYTPAPVVSFNYINSYRPYRNQYRPARHYRGGHHYKRRVHKQRYHRGYGHGHHHGHGHHRY